MSAATTAFRFAQILLVTQRSSRAVIKAQKAAGGIPKTRQREIMAGWANQLFDILGVRVRQYGEPCQKATIFVGNHMSYLDIPLLMSLVPTVFIGKKELAKWPLFGPAMKGVGTIFVDRSSAHSRKGAMDTIAPYVLKNNQSVTIFPAGTTTLNEDKPWRWGAFLIAKRHGIPLQPFRLWYQPARDVAFIDEDDFLTHLWRLLGRKGIEAGIEFHEPIQVSDPEKDAIHWWHWVREKLSQS